MKSKNYKIETILSRLTDIGNVEDPYASTHFPIYQTATFDLKKQNSDEPYDYTRSGNPTREALENVFAIATGAAGAVCTHTGIAAVALLFETVLQAGDKVLVENDTYGGTFRLLKVYKEKLNIEVFFEDFSNLEKVKNILTDNEIKLVLIESPTNPGLKIIDLAKLAEITKCSETLLAVDNSLATFISQKPLELGADFELFSTTKYVSGHGSVVAGVLAAKNKEQTDKMKFTANAQGRSQNPFDVHIVSLGVPTLPVRMKAHQENALKVAEFLESHHKVTKVTYPGLKSHPQYELAQRQMKYFAGVITCDLIDEDTAENLVNNTNLFGEKASFGTPDSRIEIPGKISHASFSEEELTKIGITKRTVRLSIGLENIDDLIDDLKRALEC